MKIVTEDTIENILLNDINGYMSYITDRLASLHAGEASAWPKKKIIYNDPFDYTGDIRPMTCFTDKVKIVKVISTNPIRKKHPSVSVGATLLLDQYENFPTHIFEATAMSGIRTAAMVSWVINHYPDEYKSILIMGKGRVGSYIKQFLKVSEACCLHTIDTDPWTASELIFKQDIIVTATDSTFPFLSKENCFAKYVISVGADTHFNRELNTDLLEGKNIYVDIEEAMEVGDLEQSPEIPISGGMFDLLEENQYPQIFISVGNALMDALTIEYLIDHGA